MMKSCVCVCVCMGVMMMLGTVKGRTDLNAFCFILLLFDNIRTKYRTKARGGNHGSDLKNAKNRGAQSAVGGGAAASQDTVHTESNTSPDKTK